MLDFKRDVIYPHIHSVYSADGGSRYARFVAEMRGGYFGEGARSGARVAFTGGSGAAFAGFPGTVAGAVTTRAVTFPVHYDQRYIAAGGAVTVAHRRGAVARALLDRGAAQAKERAKALLCAPRPISFSLKTVLCFSWTG